MGAELKSDQARKHHAGVQACPPYEPRGWGLEVRVVRCCTSSKLLRDKA